MRSAIARRRSGCPWSGRGARAGEYEGDGKSVGGGTEIILAASRRSEVWLPQGQGESVAWSCVGRHNGTVTGALILDIVLLVVLLLQAIAGWHRGFLASALGVAGLVAGAWLALWGLPQLMAPSEAIRGNPLLRSVVMLFGVLLIASIGYAVLSDTGRRIMAGRRDGVLGVGDRLIGSVMSTVMAAIIIGLASLALYPMAPATWRVVMDDSKGVAILSDRMPDQVIGWAARTTQELYAAGFPRVFGDPGQEPSLPAESPDGSVTAAPGVRRAADSVIKVHSTMISCNAAGTGSGWVVAPRRVVTNAHVVAGASNVRVQVGGTGARLPATVVAFDPSTDLAVLSVPDLRAPALERGGPLSPGDSAVVAGFPLGGPYRTEPARIRGLVDATGTDIYDRSPAQREIYSIYSNVNHGNSGGPLLTPEGRVAGTVFAKSANSPDTGFVITDAGADSLLDRAPGLTAPVSTQSCAA